MFFRKGVILWYEMDVMALDRVNVNDIREMGLATSAILHKFDRITDLNQNVVIIATTYLFKNFDKALKRRFLCNYKL